MEIDAQPPQVQLFAQPPLWWVLGKGLCRSKSLLLVRQHSQQINESSVSHTTINILEKLTHGPDRHVSCVICLALMALHESCDCTRHKYAATTGVLQVFMLAHPGSGFIAILHSHL